MKPRSNHRVNFGQYFNPASMFLRHQIILLGFDVLIKDSSAALLIKHCWCQANNHSANISSTKSQSENNFLRRESNQYLGSKGQQQQLGQQQQQWQQQQWQQQQRQQAFSSASYLNS